MKSNHAPLIAFRGLCGIILLGIIIPSFGTYVTVAKTTSDANALGNPSSAACDPQIYYRVQHCTDGTDTHYIIVDLNDPHVRLQTVLSKGPNGECNSVNPVTKDPESNCPSPYPFEKMSSMLSRYESQGGVAVINTDYFGVGGDHGAQGLAVRNGLRLDGPAHGVNNDIAYHQPSLAISLSKSITIGIPGSQDEINSNLDNKYYNTIGGAPIIVSGGQAINTSCTYPYPGDTCARTSQSAAGITSDGHLILLTAQKSSPDMASYLINYFGVQTAIKFDGGGSARLAWLDSNGNIKSWGATSEDRAVAEGLMVFSIRISTSPQPNLNFWDELKRAWGEFWTGIEQKINNWWEEQKQKMAEQLQLWWQEQQRKISDWFEQKIAEWLNQLCGSAYLAPVVLAVFWISRRPKRK